MNQLGSIPGFMVICESRNPQVENSPGEGQGTKTAFSPYQGYQDLPEAYSIKSFGVLSHTICKLSSLIREALWVMIQGKNVMLPCKCVIGVKVEDAKDTTMST